MTYQPPSTPPPAYSGQPAHATKTAWYKKTAVVATGVGVLALLVGTGIGSSSNKAKTKTEAAGTVTATETSTVTAPAPAASTITVRPTVIKTVRTEVRTKSVVYTPAPKKTIDDGTSEVGRDIPAGRYRTPGGGDCYYAVNSDANGENIDSNGDSSGPQIVDVREGKYLELSGGCTWTLA